MKILGIYDKSGPKYHRILMPLFMMDGVELISNYTIREEMMPVDIVFINRAISSTTLNDVLRLRDKYGFKLVSDFDDYWHLGKDHLIHDHYKLHRLPELMEAYIQESDAVTVTHERLAEEVYKLNKSVTVLPNAIPKFDQFDVGKYPDEKIRLFWAGSITHKNDLKLLERPLQLIKRDKVKFVLGGYVKGDPEWKQMAKYFTCNSSYNTEVIESLPVDKYYNMYSRCDVSLIPLVDNKFNSFKSNLKILEAANIAAPVIVSRVHPYLGFPEDIVNYVSGNDTWYKQINKLINRPELIKEQGRQLQEYCDINFNFAKINDKRKKLFDEITQQAKTGITQESAYQQVGNG